ncbi:hypothetical protein ACE1B6_03880 [Aerosakkonemataceae cyanobacterium BLCC-F154]|uniref:Uncharacterized protein n=1 Tax=Floridaenema fluviatile BLCC-F154 TaxID=3153640 RepID=A0ABV4Y906_9CYAN
MNEGITTVLRSVTSVMNFNVSLAQLLRNIKFAGWLFKLLCTSKDEIL